MMRRILAVEDDRAMVRTLCDSFRVGGWESRGAYSGEAAIARPVMPKPIDIPSLLTLLG